MGINTYCDQSNKICWVGNILDGAQKEWVYISFLIVGYVVGLLSWNHMVFYLVLSHPLTCDSNPLV